MTTTYVAARHYLVRPGLVPDRTFVGLRGLVTALAEAEFASTAGDPQEVIKVGPDGGETPIRRFEHGKQV